MKDFVNKILVELSDNENIKSEPLVQMLVESTNKSIALGESPEITIDSLKSGLGKINEHIKNPHLNNLMVQIEKSKDSTDSIISKMMNAANLAGKIKFLKENYSTNPLISENVQNFERALSEGYPELGMYQPFIAAFEQFSSDKAIKQQVDSMSAYINKNKTKLFVLSAIYQMEKLNTPVYAGVKNDLKTALVNEQYSADILKVRYGNTMPIITSLINDLRIIESQEQGYFTLGEGDPNTKIKNVISPALKTDEGLIILTDNRFLAIREGKETLSGELENYVADEFRISSINPKVIQEKYSNFYKVCEAFSLLGFKPTLDGTGVETSAIRNFKLQFKANEEKNLDLYLNDTKIDNPKDINLMEALVLESETIKHQVNSIFENFADIFNFEFMKDVSNDFTLKESFVLNLNDSYYVCNKPNAAERQWKKVDETELYEFFINDYKYDISPIFKIKLNESLARTKKVEEHKAAILEDISKLEETIKKLDETIASKEADTQGISKLETIKESIQTAIAELKEDFIKLDLSKKKETV
jgi:hypothetical protein